MVKTLVEDSTYEPSKRTFKWLKMKKDYLDDGMVDTFDLVPIAACYGIGKRTGKYGSFLMACYNSEWERYETVCKVIRFGGGAYQNRLELASPIALWRQSTPSSAST